MKEIERKILGINVPALIKKIRALKPTPRKIFSGLVHISYFDFSDGRIRRAKDLLRVRVITPKGGKAFTELVYKKYGGVKNGCKYFDETEFVIPGTQDAAKLRTFFQLLGIHEVVAYEKKRTLYRWGKISFEIDEHPKIPAFLEIEALSPKAIDKAIMALGFQKNEQTAETISELLVRKYPALSLKDLVFRTRAS